MARHEIDREDLMREATALRERGEWRVPDEPEPVVAGFRDDGRMSLYFGPDPAYHFDAEGRLRRAFVQGDLYRTRGDTLSRLSRVRTENSVDLLRHDLSADELSRLVSEMCTRIVRLRNALERGTASVIRQIPPDGCLTEQLLPALDLATRGRLAPAIRK